MTGNEVYKPMALAGVLLSKKPLRTKYQILGRNSFDTSLSKICMHRRKVSLSVDRFIRLI